MNVPFLDLSVQYASIRGDIDEAFRGIFSSCAFSGGPPVQAFEAAFAEYCDVRHCVGVGSGTAALELLLRAYNIGAGDEVITVSHTFFATAEAVSLTGARPVFVDVRAESGLMQPSLIEKAISEKTRAILPVHLYGQIADVDAITAIAKSHRLIVIEDCAQAHGARYHNRRAGGLADGGAFSFYPGKNLGAFGEAGAVTTNDPDIATRVRMLRDHGSSVQYIHETVGRNERMDSLQAAALLVKLKRLDAWNERRRSHAALYRSLLADCPGMRFIEVSPHNEAVYHLFVVRVPQRDRIREALSSQSIGTGIHYPIPLHLQRAYEHLAYHPGDFPTSEKLASEVLSLPIFPELIDEQIAHVATCLTDILRFSA
ncbi:DegT/DnrJ/EryC1/StrS family aminotransferase [Candidatus Peregrinibacteria bacterium]|nr:DegT/DnrJ/EryC1/StrS family aminotransferase [Candidatus Peregrinibacteria bacterium]MBI3816079.1 DegT/DnrJ/EryC1/StrS family aminotransferase [Candidatus Peregrinibacteria bacterium]